MVLMQVVSQDISHICDTDGEYRLIFKMNVMVIRTCFFNCYYVNYDIIRWDATDSDMDAYLTYASSTRIITHHIVL